MRTCNVVRYSLCGLAAVAALSGCLTCESEVALTAKRVEVVVASDAPKTVRFAADVMTNCLSRVLGTEVPVREAKKEKTGVEKKGTEDGLVSIVLGDNEWSRAAGIDVSKLPRDGFVIKSSGRSNRIFIAGRDDAKADLARQLETATYWQMQASERATLFGVYEFLERYAGCRFYFPGELGTVVPKAERIVVPVGTVTRAPVFTVREIYLQGDGPVPGETDERSRSRWFAEDWLRLRLQTTSIRCCHGQCHMKLVERFGKTHPEYFRAVKVGTNLVRQVTGTQMCQSSKLWDEIYEDAKAYLSGKPASSRGLGADWGRAYYGGNTIDAMPDDGMARCECPACEARYDKTRNNWATQLVWEQTSRLADRLEADGFRFRVTQMAYPEYKNIPEKPINTNVWVMVAESGPWSCGQDRRIRNEIDEIRGWTEKVGHKVWMWTYPSKFDTRRTSGVPCAAPRTCGRYYKMTIPYSIGSFVEGETQDSLHSYLNNYLFARVAWDADLDVDAVVDEHHRLMFGAAAPEMKAFLDDLETRWMRDIIGAWIRPHHDGLTELDAAPDVAIWQMYLTRDVRAGWKKLFDAAERKVAPGSIEARRVALYRRHFLDSIVKTGDAYDAKSDPSKARARYAAVKPEENLVPMMKEPIHIVSTNSKKGASCEIKFRDIRPGTRYRLGLLEKLNDVKLDPTTGTGAFTDTYLGDWLWFPRRAPHPAGTADWHWCEYEFTSGNKMTARAPFIRYCLAGASGEAWIDCITLQELDEKGNVVAHPLPDPEMRKRPLPKAIKTVPHELDAMLDGGHCQGASCDETGVYLIHSKGIVKIDWTGKKLAETQAPAHAGDGFAYKGKLYVAFGTRAIDGKRGIIGVYDATTLKQIRFVPVQEEEIDGLVVLNDILYYGIGHGAKTLPTTRIGMTNMKLEKIGEKTITPSFGVIFGVQTMATDGKDLYFCPYCAKNPKNYNCLRLTPKLDIIEELQFGSAEGFGMIPPSTFPGCRTPAFFNVAPMGGNQSGWRKDPVNNPPRILLWISAR